MLSDAHVDSREKRNVWKVVFILVIVTIVAVAVFQLTSQASENRGRAIQALSELPVGSSELGKLVIANYREYRTNATQWSLAYFGCLFGSAFASALAGVVLKLDILKDRPALKNDSAAALAAIAALLVTLSTSGDFQGSGSPIVSRQTLWKTSPMTC